jgi:hypothetical protein
MAVNYDFIDSFDQYGPIAGGIGSTMPAIMATNGWVLVATASSASLSLGQSYGRFSGSLGLNGSVPGATPGWELGLRSHANNAIQFDSFAFYIASVPTGFINSVLFWRVRDGSTSQLEYRLNSLMRIEIAKAGTVLATSTSTLSVGQWYRIEIQSTIDPSSGFAEVKVNTVSYVNYSGNTRNSANSYTNQSCLCILASTGNPAGVSFSFDDIVSFSGSGAAYLGDKCIRMAPANAVGDVANFTQNWAAWAASTVMAVGQQIKDSNNNIQQVQSITSDFKTGSGSHPTWATTGGITTVDNHVTWVVVGSGANPGAANWMATAEAPPDGDNSYNASSTIGNIDRFVSAAFPATCTGIVLVYETIYSRKDDAGTRSLRGSINSGGTVADNGSDFVQNSTYAYFNPFFLTDPNTAAAWTIGAVNGLTGWGYKVTA